MKYKIQEVITISSDDDVEIRDIIYHDLTEQEFLVRYLANPDLVYWAIHDDGTRDMYRKNKHMARVHPDGSVTNIPGITGQK